MIQLTGDWNRATRVLDKLVKSADNALRKSAIQASVLQQKIWVDGIVDGKFKLKPLSLITKDAKQSSKVLVDHGNLVRSIQRYPITPYVYFIGIHRNARRRSEKVQPLGGDRMIDIALTHEVGGVIKPRFGKALAVPMTRKASRAGSPLNYPDKLTFVRARGKNKNVIGSLCTEKYTKEKTKGVTRATKVAYLLFAKVTLPARPHRAMAYDEFLKQAPKEIGDSFKGTLVNELET